MKVLRVASFILPLLSFGFLDLVLAASSTNRTVAGPFFTPFSHEQERLNMYIEIDDTMTRITTQSLFLVEIHQIISLLHGARAHILNGIERDSGLPVKQVIRLQMIDADTLVWLNRAAYRLHLELQDATFTRYQIDWIATTQRSLDRDVAQSEGDALHRIDTWSSLRLLVMDKIDIFADDISLVDRLSLLLLRVNHALCEWREWRGQGDDCSGEEEEHDLATIPLPSTRFQSPTLMQRMTAFFQRRRQRIAAS